MFVLLRRISSLRGGVRSSAGEPQFLLLEAKTLPWWLLKLQQLWQLCAIKPRESAGEATSHQRRSPSKSGAFWRRRYAVCLFFPFVLRHISPDSIYSTFYNKWLVLHTFECLRRWCVCVLVQEQIRFKSEKLYLNFTSELQKLQRFLNLHQSFINKKVFSVICRASSLLVPSNTAASGTAASVASAALCFLIGHLLLVASPLQYLLFLPKWCAHP